MQIIAPTITGFDVKQVERLSPCNEVAFTLYGTPGGKASVRVNGMQGKVFLDETTAGNYQGSYIGLESGGTQTVTYATQPPFRIGDRVRIEGNLLVAN